MNKILSTKQAIQIATKLNNQKKRIVLTGGCFDILHVGHLTFLKKAKEQGQKLFVFVEPDETITKIKGPTRPFNTQQDRAFILSSLSFVDYVITLPPFTNNKDYDDLVIALKPAIIATTQGDTNRKHKERQARLINAKVLDVTAPVTNQSTTRLITRLNEIN